MQSGAIVFPRQALGSSAVRSVPHPRIAALSLHDSQGKNLAQYAEAVV